VANEKLCNWKMIVQMMHIFINYQINDALIFGISMCKKSNCYLRTEIKFAVQSLCRVS